jgi:hypothetical protein
MEVPPKAFSQSTAYRWSGTETEMIAGSKTSILNRFLFFRSQLTASNASRSHFCKIASFFASVVSRLLSLRRIRICGLSIDARKLTLALRSGVRPWQKPSSEQWPPSRYGAPDPHYGGLVTPDWAVSALHEVLARVPRKQCELTASSARACGSPSLGGSFLRSSISLSRVDSKSLILLWRSFSVFFRLASLFMWVSASLSLSRNQQLLRRDKRGGDRTNFSLSFCFFLNSETWDAIAFFWAWRFFWACLSTSASCLKNRIASHGVNAWTARTLTWQGRVRARSWPSIWPSLHGLHVAAL